MGQRHDPVLVALAVANEQLVFAAFDVVDRQPETFAQTQPATVDELERSAIAAQADVGEQVMDLLAGEHGGQRVVVLGADLGEERPVLMPRRLTKNMLAAARAWRMDLGFQCFLSFTNRK